MCSDENISAQTDVSAVYNARNPAMSLFSCLRWLCVLIVFPGMTLAADWRAPEAQLAEKIASVTGPGVIALQVNNGSSIPPAEVEAIRHGLSDDLANSGIRVWEPDQAAAVVKVTLSENLQSYIWIAEIQQGTSEPSILIISLPRPDLPSNLQASMPVTLHAATLVSAPEPILDAAILEGSPRRILALGAAAVTIYDFKDGRWVETQALPIDHAHPSPRDLRGRIVLRSDHLFDAYLPGLVCRSTNASPLAMTCSHNDDPWSLQTQELGVSGFFSPTRNFFTGALAPGVGKQKTAPQFYAAAAIPREKYMLWIFAGVDGQLHLLDGINQQIAANIHWGSDIAGVHAQCRPGAQVIATSSTNDDTDWVQAFEFADREPVAASQRLNVNGRIGALWTANDGNSAIAVYRDLDSGNYEAVQLTLTCGQ
jgi:hypothetical protein